ncbi:hypothetical protein GCM10010508_16710 [Streptomyces naganishii JCM 4654]|uniref:Uncharacterized protein n=1 Tax=Streptomyces naganishii JCM 4654 TaxID=1306179 RepID=A0A918Y229_9ACTN|nr:hypothetical protein GCM10010508_16710 [Streptomyces naganishii JCM 4654]
MGKWRFGAADFVMTQYEPTRTPFAVAVGTDPEGIHDVMPLTWGFELEMRRKSVAGLLR